VADVLDSPENAATCLCGNCPSKNEDGMSFYCVRGTSSMSVNRCLCTCNWCPLWSGYGLTRVYNCDKYDGADESTGGDGSLGGDEVMV
jgi:hypothetical protein